jgi:hypothetical protein
LGALAGVAGLDRLQLDGEDVSDILRGEARSRRRPLFWEWRFRIAGPIFHHSPQLAVRDGNWKLYLNPDRSRIELYDLPRDPTQLDNVAGQYPDVVERLADLALKWREGLPVGHTDPGAGRADYAWPKSK